MVLHLIYIYHRSVIIGDIVGDGPAQILSLNIDLYWHHGNSCHFQHSKIIIAPDTQHYPMIKRSTSQIIAFLVNRSLCMVAAAHA